MIDSNSKYYLFTVTDQEKQKIIGEIGTSLEIDVWSKKNSMAEIFTVEKKRPDQGRLFLRRSEFLDQYLESPFSGSDIFFKFDLNKIIYFSTGKLIFQQEERVYSLDLPDAFFQGRRRKDCRIGADEFNKIICTIHGKEFICEDLSVGGIGVTMDQNIFVSGSYLENVSIRFNGRLFTIPTAEVVKQIGERVALKFVDISDEDDQQLFLLINAAVIEKMKRLESI